MSLPKLSDAEWKVMNAVWADHPTTARRALEALEPATGWAYSTVKTMLDRLVEKGALSSSMEGITTVYEPAVTQRGARRSAARALAERAFDGGVGSLMHFLVQSERLTAREKRELRRMLEDDA